MDACRALRVVRRRVGRKSARQTNYTAGVTYQPWKYLRCQLNYTYERYGGTNPDRNVIAAMLTGVF